MATDRPTDIGYLPNARRVAKTEIYRRCASAGSGRTPWTLAVTEGNDWRRLLETVLANRTFDRGTLCPTYAKPFDPFVRADEDRGLARRLQSAPATQLARAA